MYAHSTLQLVLAAVLPALLAACGGGGGNGGGAGSGGGSGIARGGSSTTASLTLSAISPVSGSKAGGTVVTFTGSGFDSTTLALVNDLPCASQVIRSESQIDCTTPAGPAGAVNVGVGNSSNGLSAQLDAAYTYIYIAPPPTVSAISPAAGPLAGNQTVTITGLDFVAGATVKVGGVDCGTVTVVSATQLTCKTGAHAAGAVSAQVTNPDGQSGSLASAYTYRAAPAITSVSPSAGPLAGGQSITINGSGFLSGASATLGGVACTSLTVVSATQLTCTTGAHASGAVTASVTNSDAQSGSLASAYTYQDPAPTISSVSPVGGALAGGTAVTVTGTGFASGATVSVGGVSCGSLTVVSATQITCTTGAHAAGAVTAQVTNPDTQSGSLASAYTYRAAPTVTSVSPTWGSSGGGTSVTINGTGFVAGAAAGFGGVSCTSLTVVNATKITCTTASAPADLVDVQVTNVEGQSGSLVDGYTYADALTLSPTPVTISVDDNQDLDAAGGVAPYTFAVVAGGANGTVDVDTGTFSATAVGSSTVRVTDSVGNTANASITINAALAISPTSANLIVSGTQQFTVSGGVGSYTYSVPTGTGSVDASGFYTAPASPSSEVVRVTDTYGHTADAALTIYNGVSIVPLTKTLGVNQTFAFTAAGSYTTVAYSMVSGGGSIDAGTGVYTAPNAEGSASARVTASPSGLTSDAAITIIRPTQLWVSVGGYHSCAAFTDGGIRCWGLNSSGQLGYGDTTSRGAAANQMADNLKALNFGGTVTDLALGDTHTCALYSTGAVKCWGGNTAGQLGYDNKTSKCGSGGPTCITSLAAVNLGTGRTAKAIFAGYKATCAILDNDTLKCWGMNSYGQLGQGYASTTTTNANYAIGDGVGTNTMAALNPIIGMNWDGSATTGAFVPSKVAMGQLHTCVLSTSGTVKCFGRTNYGQIGYGSSTANKGDAAGEMAALDCVGDTDSNAATSQCGAGIIAKDLSLGRFFSCVILSGGADDNKVKCWGRSNAGQLLKGGTSNLGDGAGEIAALTPLDMGATDTVAQLQAGFDHVCVRVTDGTVKCWGNAAGGALGNASTTASQGDTAGETTALNVDVGQTVVSLGVGRAYGCVILGTGGAKDSSIKCWGGATNGALGNGSTSSSYGDAAGEMGATLPIVNF